MKHHFLILLPATVFILVAVAGCGGSTGTSAATSGTVAATPKHATSSGNTASATITIKNFAYTMPSTISPGETISVHNEDDAAHTVTADAGTAFNLTVPASGTATFTAPIRPGSYPFHCTYHANMHATLTVR
jgi:plastocyanin